MAPVLEIIKYSRSSPDMVPVPMTRHSTRASRVKVGPRMAMPREMFSLTSSCAQHTGPEHQSAPPRRHLFYDSVCHYLRVWAEGKFGQRTGFGQVDEQEEEGQSFTAGDRDTCPSGNVLELTLLKSQRGQQVTLIFTWVIVSWDNVNLQDPSCDIISRELWFLTYWVLLCLFWYSHWRMSKSQSSLLSLFPFVQT